MNLFPIEKNGISTMHGLKKYRKHHMQDGQNHLFGAMKGKEVGLSYDYHFSNRNANVLVVGSAGTGKSYNYVESNLLQENHSAIVVDKGGVYTERYAEYFRKRGHQVYVMDFSNPETSCRFNPFLNIPKKNPLINVTDEKFHTIYLMEMIKRLGFKVDDFPNCIHDALLLLAFYYTAFAPDLHQNERTFSKAMEVLQTLHDKGRSAISEFALGNEYKILEETHENLFRSAIVIAMKNLQPLSLSPCFEENENKPILSIETLTSQQSYLFISHHWFKVNSILTSGFLSFLTYAMYYHCESSPHKNGETLFPRHVQVYLDEFPTLNISALPTLLATCKHFGIGISVIIQSIDQLERQYGEDWENIPACCDTMLFASTLHQWKSDISWREKVTGVFCEIPFDKWLVAVRGCSPVICDKLNPNNYKEKDT